MNTKTELQIWTVSYVTSIAFLWIGLAYASDHAVEIATRRADYYSFALGLCMAGLLSMGVTTFGLARVWDTIPNVIIALIGLVPAFMFLYGLMSQLWFGAQIYLAAHHWRSMILPGLMLVSLLLLAFSSMRAGWRAMRGLQL